MFLRRKWGENCFLKSIIKNPLPFYPDQDFFSLASGRSMTPYTSDISDVLRGHHLYMFLRRKWGLGFEIVFKKHYQNLKLLTPFINDGKIKA